MHFPEALISSLRGLKGFDEQAFLSAHKCAPPVSVRLNPRKAAGMEANDLFMVSGKVPWTGYGYYLAERPSFTIDPLLHAGAYYVQEASSMFLEFLMKNLPLDAGPKTILDLCAAPGGKSTLLHGVMGDDDLLVSNEVIKTRASILVENLTKWGAPNAVTTNNDPKDFQNLGEFFDVIVVDAPCSGSGLFRKDAQAINEWSTANVEHCCQRQERILEDILPALKTGGYLVYSTCSYSPLENENVLDHLSEKHKMQGVDFAVNDDWNIVTTSTPGGNTGFRFYPDKLQGEGFFIGVMHKMEPVENKAYGKIRKPFEQPSKIEKEMAAALMNDSDKYAFIAVNEEVIALPGMHKENIQFIRDNLYVKKAGIVVGQASAKEFVPDHVLALSGLLHKDFPRVEATLEEAREYLRKNDPRIGTGIRGRAAVTYKNLPLGFAKFLPGRMNNCYPTAWRIINK